MAYLIQSVEVRMVQNCHYVDFHVQILAMVIVTAMAAMNTVLLKRCSLLQN